MTISAAQASAALRAKQGQTVLVSLTGEEGTFFESVTVGFDSTNWAAGQTIYVKAISDDAEEGKAVVAISHSVVHRDANGNVLNGDPLKGPVVDGHYDGYQISNVLVTVIDDDKPAVLINETGGSTAVIEGGGADSYTVELSRPPAAGETVTVTVIGRKWAGLRRSADADADPRCQRRCPLRNLS